MLVQLRRPSLLVIRCDLGNQIGHSKGWMLHLWIPRGDRQPAPTRPQNRTDLSSMARKVPLGADDLIQRESRDLAVGDKRAQRPAQVVGSTFERWVVISLACRV